MTFKRGDIVEWMGLRHVVLSVEYQGFHFVMPDGEILRRDTQYRMWPAHFTQEASRAVAVSVVGRESEMTATGETATEVVDAA